MTPRRWAAAATAVAVLATGVVLVSTQDDTPDTPTTRPPATRGAPSPVTSGGIYSTFEPVTGAVVNVPLTITSVAATGTSAKGGEDITNPSCTTNVSDALITFLKAPADGGSVPDNSIVVFPANRCYAIDLQITINDRNNLVIDGNGSEFRTVTCHCPAFGQESTDAQMCRSNFRIGKGRNINFHNVRAYGSWPMTTPHADPNTPYSGTGYNGPRSQSFAGQCQHGFAFDGTEGSVLKDSEAFNMRADPFAMEPDTRNPYTFCETDNPAVSNRPARWLTVDNFLGINAGRTVGITNARDITIKNSYISEMWDSLIDLETDDQCEWTKDISITNNVLGKAHYGLVAYGGSEPSARSGNFVFSGNVQEETLVACYPVIDLQPLLVFGTAGIQQWEDIQRTNGAPLRRSNYTITNNTIRAIQNGINVALLDNVEIQGNIFHRNYGQGCTDPVVETYPHNYVAQVRKSNNVHFCGNTMVAGEFGGFGGENGGLYWARDSVNVTSTAPPCSVPATTTTAPGATTTSTTAAVTTTTAGPGTVSTYPGGVLTGQ